VLICHHPEASLLVLVADVDGVPAPEKDRRQIRWRVILP
jgi:hypothetical protein